jgi:N-acetylglucosaminyldiphosphoundecaprenol N-acetyl-beta-D-mannosaminyltransferase
MSPLKTIRLFDYDILASDIGFLQTGSKSLINTINQYSYIIAEKDPEFKKALRDADVLLPDGIGMVVAARLIEGKKIKKIAGADLHHYLLEKLEAEAGSCFYLGSSEKTLGAIKKRLDVEFPSVKSGFYSPPYKLQFTEEDNTRMIDAVNSFKPDVLFVGMTAPKQEKWSGEHNEMLDANVICSIGAVFDFYAGTIERPGKVWINMGLEWFMRLLKEPKRMSKRYIYYGVPFVLMLIKETIRRPFRKKADNN